MQRNKINIRVLLLFCILFGIQNRSLAQTTLTPGDILFTGFNSVATAGTAPDTLAFVVLTPIAAGTVIYFTDRGYQGGTTWQAAGGTEGTISWTVSSALAIGDEVEIYGFNARVNAVANGTVAQVAGGNAITGLSLGNTGDGLVAFQNGAGDPTNIASTMIAGISWQLNCGTTSDASWNVSGCTYGPQSSLIPPGLTNGTSAMLAGVAGSSPGYNSHGKFQCTGTPYSTVAALRAAVLNKANWIFDVSTVITAFNIPSGCLYYSTCVPPVITANPPNRAICAGSSTTFTSNASGATAFQWQENSGSGFIDIVNGGVYSNATTNTLTITGATAGMNGYLYRCTAINGAASCFTNTSQATLTVSSVNTSSASQTNVSCNGGSNGAASVSPTGGIAPYSYSWSPSGGTGSNTTGLSAGSYTVTVTDNIGCQGTRNYTITQPPVLNGSTVVTNVACNGGTNGAINLTPSGGTPGYTFSWVSGPTTEDRTGLAAGTYSVTITDANACTRNVTGITVTQPTAVSGSTIITNVACNSGTTGSIDLTPSGGTPGYTYNWGGGVTSQDRTILSAGTYSVTITDANACTGTVSATVTQPTAVSGSTVVTNVACFGGNTGAINLTPTGGTPGYTFNWVGGITTEDRTSLSAGTYSVTITDANGCTGTVSPTVTQPAASVSGTTVVTNVACFGGNTGAINLTPTGGVGPYTFNWVGGITTEDRTSLSAGTYSVTITDANGCTGTVSPTVTQPAASVSGTTVVTNVACFGGNTGAINLTPTGGVGPYTFNWVGGVTTEDRTSLSAGTYSVTITDANGCTGTVSPTLTQPASVVSGTTVVTNVACFGGNTGAINLTPTGGVGPYTFNWVGGITTEDRTSLSAGTYSVTITDANGCTGTVSPTVTQPAASVSGTTVVTNVACFGGNTGAINLTPTGGVGPYTFNWVGGVTTEDRTSLSAGTYSVTITDANGCTGTVSPTLTQPASVVSGTTVVTNVACFGGNTGAINLTPTGGVGPYTFNWVGGVTTEDRTSLSAGTYSVTITDANGCTGTVSPTVTQPASVVSGTTVVTNVACFGGNTGAINLTPTGGVGPYTFNWVGGVTTEDRTSLSAGTYSVTITDANGCTGTVSPTVTQPAASVSGTTVVTNVACFGGNTGAINLTPTGGVGPYTFNWGGGITTEDRTSLSAGTYSVTITDANGCTGTVSPTVTQPASVVSGTTVVTNVACFGGSNGAINLTPNGGAGPYTFSWVSGPTTEDRTGLAAGTYSVTITDANACTGTVSGITVTQPTAISVTPATQTNVSCNGGSNGAASINTPTGGAGGYTYNWTPGTPTGDGTVSVTGLSATTYTCTVTDANGCTASQNFTVTQPTAISVTPATQTNVSCNGGSNGAASINTPTGGAGGYTYNWTPGTPTGDGTVSVTGLSATTYTCTVTDANGCTASQNFTVTQPTAISVTPATQTNVSCNGGSNGAASINTPTGGAGGYTYNWTPGTPTGDGTVSVTGLSATTYTCTVTDANGCTASQNFTVTQPTAISVTPATQTNVSCNGGSNGAASINTPTGGAGGYTYNWTPGTPTGDGTVSVTGLSATTYTCTVTDANGCTASQNFTVTQPTAISVTPATQTNVSCNGGSNGAASINTPTGGAGGYTYNWTPGTPTGDGTVSVTGLSATTYTCTVTDANGCTASQNFTVTQPTAISVTPATQTNVSCNGGSNGAASINTPTGGAGGYTYNWTPGTPTGDGTVSVTGLSATTYTCTVTDANGCTASQNFTVTQPTAISVTPATQTNVSCNGGSNGAASINTPTGGAGGYTYNWTPGTPTGDGTTSITGLAAGTYTVTATDANGCTRTQSVTITQPAVLVATAGSQANVSCFGGSNGSATVNVTGGTGTYTYSWSPSGGTGATASGLAAGTYTVTVQDINLCQTTQSFTISQPPVLVASASAQTNVSCFGGSNGSATVNVTGGTGTYTYSWSPSGGTGATASGLVAGTYTVTVNDANLCQATQSFTITQPPVLAITPAASSNVSCFGGSNGAASINTATGGTGIITYDWTPGTPTGDGTTSISSLSAGTYVVTATDQNGCTATQSFTITQSPLIVITPTQTNVACFGGSTGSASASVAGGFGTYTYSWSPSVGTAATATGLAAGTYTLTVTDANLCTMTQSYTITQPSAPLTLTPSQTNVSCFGENDGAASVTAAGGTGTYTYLWTPGGSTSSSITGLLPGVYSVTVKDANLCTATQSFTITQPPVSVSSMTQVACNSYTLNGTTYTSSGTYTQVLTNSIGCDSTLTLNLTVKQSSSSSMSATSCDSYTLNGTTYTTTGVYTQVLQNAVGCDSTITLNLTINNSSSYTLNATGCDSYTLNGTTYTASGTYTQVLTNQVGCDWNFTLNLTIKNSSATSLTQSACGSYTLNGQTYNASGVYTQTLTNAVGCDSVITLNLTIKQPTSSSITQTACGSYTLNGQTYNTSGTFTQTLTNAAGCDSVLTLNLTIQNVNTAATQDGTVLTATETGASYQWINCTTGNAIEGETNQTFTATSNGSYAVIVTDENCSDTSACLTVSTVGISENATVVTSVNVYPNPNEGEFTIKLSETNAKIDVELYDINGKLIMRRQFYNTDVMYINETLASGVYSVRIITANNVTMKTIIRK